MCLIFYEAGSLHSLKIAEQRIATSGFNASHSIYGPDGVRVYRDEESKLGQPKIIALLQNMRSAVSHVRESETE